ncbi:guanine nucleotide binding protein, alpha subunit [Coprinopsis sp. MPI-PUGE-AT-0042]|nr:guanine nucleotide binding protein, alpha subunit [Coprinopsis sp. MPI-PUGE-AT-0042]
MGAQISLIMDQKAAKAHSDKIDEQIQEDSLRFKRECKVLLMGTDQSGISTLVRQMKIIHQGGFSEAELSAFRPGVYKTVMESAYQVVNYMSKAGLNCVHYSNRGLTDKILEFYVTALGEAHPTISVEIAEAIDQLWKDPIIPKIMEELCGQFDTMDSTGYFLSEVLRHCGKPGT